MTVIGERRDESIRGTIGSSSGLKADCTGK